MRNERMTDPDFFSAPVPSGTLSGAPVIVLGGIPAVCSTKEGEGGNIAGRASVQTRGVFPISTTDAVASEGTLIYLTPSPAFTPTTTSAGNTLFGRTVHSAEGTGGTKGAGAGTVNVRLAKV